MPGSQQVRAQAEARGPRRDLQGGRLRLARRRLLDVPRHEPGHRSRPASAAPRPRTATSRAARAAAAARTSSRRRWPPRPPSRAISSTSATGAEDHGADHDDPGRVSVLDRADVDTDQIMPKQFLKRVERTGFGEFLFYDWAKEDGWDLPRQPDPRHRARTSAAARAASTRRGRCRTTASRRSSRRASPTSSTRTARRSACCRSCSPRRTCKAVARPARPRSTSTRTRSVRRAGATRSRSTRSVRHRLLNGLDDIAMTLQSADEIEAYERERERTRPRHDRALGDP